MSDQIRRPKVEVGVEVNEYGQMALEMVASALKPLEDHFDVEIHTVTRAKARG